MAAPFRIDELVIATASGSRSLRFDAPVTAVTGPIGTGKSSMFELIKFALGGSASLMPAIQENVRRVTLRVRVGSRQFELGRDIDGRVVDVFDRASSYRASQWATTARKAMPRASEELLAALDLPPDLRVPRRRVRPTAETVPVSFFDLYRYIYLSQNEIDYSVVGHRDPNLDIKRRAVFEILYGLVSPELLQLRRARNDLIARQKQLKEDANTVRRFLADQGERDAAYLKRQLGQSVSRRSDAEQSLANLKSSSLELLEDQRYLRDRIGVLRRDILSSESQQEVVAAEIAKDEAVLAQLSLDEQMYTRQRSAAGALSGLEFSVCPRCLQSVNPDSAPVGHCGLCHQLDPASAPVGVESELRRIRLQRSETEELLAEDRAAAAELQARVTSMRSELAELAAQLDEQSRHVVSPRLDAVETTVRELTAAEAAIAAIERSLARWADVSGLEETADAIDESVRELSREEKQLELQISDNYTNLDELSETFNELVSALNLPWYESAHVDRETYMPIVNGNSFDMLSVGGARKTIVNLAYHLANLTYALASPDVRMPALLLLDSPRKNVGREREDIAVSEAIYARLRAIQTGYGDKAQIIMADNDLPSSARRWIKEIPLSYDQPLVPGVVHPGEDVETLGSRAPQASDS